MPVCGCDGVTYGNGCYATNYYGITSFTEGECDNIVLPPVDCIDSSLINPNLACTMIYDPVCGCDGVTYSNGCIAAIGFGITNYTMGECTSVSIDYISLLNVNIYPNPASFTLNVDFLSNGEHKTHDVKLIDFAGKTMFFDNERNESQYSIPLKDFSDGIYFLHILSDDKSLIKKVIINK